MKLADFESTFGENFLDYSYFVVSEQNNDRLLPQLSQNFSTSVIADTAAGTGTTVSVKYRMRGYFIAGATYEFWITTDPTVTNPSGNPLINKSVDSIIT